MAARSSAVRQRANGSDNGRLPPARPMPRALDPARQKIKIARSDVPGNVPTGLEVGELGIDIAATPRMWVGCPPAIDASGLLPLHVAAPGGPYLPLSSLPLSVANGGIPAGGAQYQVLGKTSAADRAVAWQTVGQRPNSNTAAGLGALDARTNTSATANVAFGQFALSQGDGFNFRGNTAIGTNTMAGITGDSLNNIGLGGYAGTQFGSTGTNSLTTANACIYIGHSSRAAANDAVNEIVIGSTVSAATPVVGRGSNTVTLGSDAITQLWCGGRDLLAGAFLPLTGGQIHNLGADDPLTIYADATRYARIQFTVAAARNWVVGANADGTFVIGDNTAPRIPLQIDDSGTISISGNLAAAAGSVAGLSLIASSGYVYLNRPALRAWGVGIAADGTFRITDETVGGIARLSIDLSGHTGVGGNLDAPYGSVKGISIIADGGYFQLLRPALRTWAMGVAPDSSFVITDETGGGMSRLSIDALGHTGVAGNLNVPYGSVTSLSVASQYLQLNRPTVRSWAMAPGSAGEFLLVDETAGGLTRLTIGTAGNITIPNSVTVNALITTNGGTAGVNIGDRGGAGSWILYGSGGNLHFYDSTDRVRIASTWMYTQSVGSMVSGTSWSGWDGSNWWAGSAAAIWQTVSDPSLKDVLPEPRGGTSILDGIKQLRPVRYRWKAGETEPDGTARLGDAAPIHWGFLAPDVAQVFGDDFGGYHKSAAGGVQSIQYNDLVAVLWRGVQELITEVEELRTTGRGERNNANRHHR